MVYANPQGLKIAFAEIIGLQPSQVFFTDAPHELSPPPGVDWADYEDREEGPPIRTPRPAWDWYLQQYPGLAKEPPTPEAIAAWAPPEPEPTPQNPVTDVDRLRQGVALYKAANDAAKEIILSLMVMVAGALIALKLFTEENVNDEGAKFVAFHRDALTDFERAGRNRLAAQALLAAIKDPASVSTFEWLKESAVMAVFESVLTY